MIKIERRNGEAVDLSNIDAIPVSLETGKNTRWISPAGECEAVILPYELDIPEGYEAVFTPIGYVAMNNPAPDWTGHVDVTNDTRIIPPGKYGYKEGFWSFYLRGKPNGGAGSPLRPNETHGFLRFRKREPSITPNQEIKRPGRPKKAA